MRFIVPDQVGDAADCIRALRLAGVFPSEVDMQDLPETCPDVHTRAIEAIIEARHAAYRKSYTQSVYELVSESSDQNLKLDLYHTVNTVRLSQAGVWTDLMRINSKSLRRLGDTNNEIIKRCRICLQKERMEVDKRLRYMHPKIREMGHVTCPPILVPVSELVEI